MDAHDHRKLGAKLDLFHQQEEAPGTAFWHSKGTTICLLIESYIRSEMQRAGFLEVRTPQLMSRTLWERSGHWSRFGDNMFVFEDGNRQYALKPMNCPGHIQLFRQQLRSYRDLPVRFNEFGVCHRYEPSGALHGLKRVRAFTQDDAHVFCAPEHINGEVSRFCQLLKRMYRRFGFDDFKVGLSTRPDNREGSDEIWDEAEATLASAARAAGLSFQTQPGDGAFYGPKLEFILTDCQDREWQCGTIQLDLVLPERLDLNVASSDGERVRPVVIHHAVLGSFERFVAMLLEHHRGRLPFWLAPEQIVICPVSGQQDDYARDVFDEFASMGFRCVVDVADETLSRRIVSAREQGIPIFVAVGKREANDQSVSLRDLNGNQIILPIDEAISYLKSMEA
ncbi:MAG: threonine--tRNA ligase [Pseudomonadota bacterium]